MSKKKTAFYEAGRRHVAKIMENHDTHGWLIAGLLREMLELEGKAMFECVESDFCAREASKLHFCGKNGRSDFG